jgi:pimeloyl-ACP methyl ester carboxylesterase
MISQRFFAHLESPLFGVYHKPRGRSAASKVRATVICPPIGQEYNRTHWTLRLFANQIARNGIHVLRMDYHGIGDSAENVDQIDSLKIWRDDIEQAIDHLKKESGAETVLLTGLRLGGALAAEVAMERPDVNGLVLWESIIEGQSYLDSLRKMHATMLDLWVCKMKSPNDSNIEEILGSQFQRSLVDEIEQLKLDLSEVVQPQLIVDSETRAGIYSHPEPGTQFIIEDERATSWCELAELESAWLRPDILRQLVRKMKDMFDRLERFNALVAAEAIQ